MSDQTNKLIELIDKNYNNIQNEFEVYVNKIESLGLKINNLTINTQAHDKLFEKFDSDIDAIKEGFANKSEIEELRVYADGLIQNLQSNIEKIINGLETKINDNVPEIKSVIEGLSNLRNSLSTNYPTFNDIKNLATKAEVNALEKKIKAPNMNGYAKKSELPDTYSKDEINTKISSITVPTVDVSNLATKSELNGYAKIDDLPDASNLVTKAEVKALEKKIKAPKMDDYAKKSDLDGLKVKIPDVSVIESRLSVLENAAPLVTPVYSRTEVDTIKSDLEARIQSGAGTIDCTKIKQLADEINNLW